jgi:hypothetical protein
MFWRMNKIFWQLKLLFTLNDQKYICFKNYFWDNVYLLEKIVSIMIALNSKKNGSDSEQLIKNCNKKKSYSELIRGFMLKNLLLV